MLNSISSVNIQMNNPANGIIQKSHLKSFFMKVHHSSIAASELFDIKPRVRIGTGYADFKYVSVLQVLLMSDGYLLTEVISKEELEAEEKSNAK